MNGQPALDAMLAALLKPTALLELGLLALCLGLAWWLCSALRPAAAAAGPGLPAEAGQADLGGMWFGRRGFDGALFPVVALALAALARLALKSHWLAPVLGHVPVAVFQIAVPVLASLAVIRVSVRVLHAAFPNSALMRALERTISWGMWIVAVLWTTGLLPVVMAEADAVSWKIGGAPVTLRSLVEGGVSAVAVLLLMLWLSSLLEARLLRADSMHLSVRKMAANALRALLLLVGLLFALSAAGIPLGALGVMGGAVGVGIGLGLQRLAANYVSGFVLLAERAIRIGDMVRVDNFEGRITDITTRYTVVRAANGREAIVPNETLVTQRVENFSYADPNVALTTVVQVAYGTDLQALAPRLQAAMLTVPRVLASPGPAVQLSNFAADGLELTLVFWIADVENGQGNVRSEVNLAVLAALSDAGVEIPFPQRVMRTLPAEPAPAAPPAPLPALRPAAGPPAGAPAAAPTNRPPAATDD